MIDSNRDYALTAKPNAEKYQEGAEREIVVEYPVARINVDHRRREMLRGRLLQRRRSR